MSRRTLLRLPRACSLQSLLEALVACTNQRQGVHRPQVATLKPLMAGPAELPAFIDAHHCNVGLICGEVSTATWLAGDVLLWIRCRPLPERGSAEDGLLGGEILLDVWQGDQFPLSPKEVEWFITDFCGCKDHEWQRLSPCWQKLQSICAEDSLDTAALAEAGDEPVESNLSAPQDDGGRSTRRRRRSTRHTGKPRTQTTMWLQDEIAALDDLYAYDPLYPEWLARAWHEAGEPPRNPYNSFKQAAEGCIERILAQRN